MENSEKNEIKLAFKTAFPNTVPILAGFVFLGTAYGIYMNSLGFPAAYPIFMSIMIFAGSMEFVAASLLLSAFNPIAALMMTLIVNARHLFYGISMLEKYKNLRIKKFYVIFGMCDESFSINCTAKIPENVDKGWFYFFVTLLNHIYWVLGATIGGICGTFINFDAKGLDFVMTALLTVIFIEQWLKEKTHKSSMLGVGLSFVCLLLFGKNNFVIPSMMCIIAALTFMKKAERDEETCR